MLLYNTIRNGIRAVSGRATGQRFAYREKLLDPENELPFLNEQIMAFAGPRRMRTSVFHDNQTGETRDMRAAYRKAAWSEPTVKSALLGKIISVCSLDLQVKPATKNNPRDKRVADFVKHALKNSEDGIFGIIWEILTGALIDGWSCSNIIFREEDRGDWIGFRTLRTIKAKDTRYLQPEIDRFRNVTGIFAMRANSAHRFDTDDFVIFTYLKLFSNPTGISDLRAAYRAIEMMPVIMRLRAIFLEKYSGPWIKGKLSDMALRGKMAQELAKARGQGFIVLDKDSDVEVIDMAVRGTSDFQDALDDLRKEIVTAISGAYLHMMTSAAGDPRGDSNVHAKTVEGFVWMLAEMVSNVLRNQLIPKLVDYNFGAGTPLPIVTLEAVSPQDILDDLKIDEVLAGMRFPLVSEDVYERARRPIPMGTEPVMKFELPPVMPGGVGNIVQNLPGNPYSQFAELVRAHFPPATVAHSGEDWQVRLLERERQVYESFSERFESQIAVYTNSVVAAVERMGELIATASRGQSPPVVNVTLPATSVTIAPAAVNVEPPDVTVNVAAPEVTVEPASVVVNVPTQ